MKLKEILEIVLDYIIDFNPFLYRPEYKLGKYKTEIHKIDKDGWPSYPHLHVIDDRVKINIYTGEVYRITTKQMINELTDKDMKRLWNDRKFLENVLFARRNKPINVGKLEEIPYKWINDNNLEWVKENDSIN